jgi:GNAT superfamily N-acetyltransferase
MKQGGNPAKSPRRGRVEWQRFERGLDLLQSCLPGRSLGVVAGDERSYRELGEGHRDTDLFLNHMVYDGGGDELNRESTRPTIRPLIGPDVERVHSELVELYATCFAEPPWSEGPDEVASYAERIRTWTTRSGFTGLLARRDGTLVAAAYGWFGRPEVAGVPMPGVGHSRVFHTGDLMVHPSARRQGLGRVLLDRLVAGRQPAALVTHPDSSARRLYEAAGWRPTGRFAVLGGLDRIVYALDSQPPE